MKKLTIIAFTLLLTACSSQVQQGSIQQAYSNFEDRDYEDTLMYINQAETIKSTTPDMHAELTYLKAKTFQKMGRYEEEEALYKYLLEQYPRTQYGYLAKEQLDKIKSTKE